MNTKPDQIASLLFFSHRPSEKKVLLAIVQSDNTENKIRSKKTQALSLDKILVPATIVQQLAVLAKQVGTTKAPRKLVLAHYHHHQKP